MLDKTQLKELKMTLTNLGFPKFFSILNKRKKAIINLSDMSPETELVSSYIDFESDPKANILTSIRYRLGSPTLTINMGDNVSDIDKLTDSKLRVALIKIISSIEGYTTVHPTPIDSYVDYDKVIYDMFMQGLFDVVGVYNKNAFNSTLEVYVISNTTSLPISPDLDWFIKSYTEYLERDEIDKFKIDKNKLDLEYKLLKRWIDTGYDVELLCKGNVSLYSKIQACETIATVLKMV